MSTLILTIIFVVSFMALFVLLGIRLRDLRRGKLEVSEIPHYDYSLFIKILIFIKNESIVFVKRGLQNSLIFLVKLWILFIHKIKYLVKKYLPMLKSRKHIWESTGTLVFHNFNEYRAKIRRFKRHIKEKEEQALQEVKVIGKDDEEVENVDEKENLV